MPKYRVRVTRDALQYVDVVVAVDLPSPIEIAGSKYVPDAMALAEMAAMKTVGDRGEKTDAWKLIDDDHPVEFDTCDDPALVDDLTPVGVIMEVAKSDPTATTPTLYLARIEGVYDDIALLVMINLATNKTYTTRCPSAAFTKVGIPVDMQFLYASHSGAQEPLHETADIAIIDTKPEPGQFPRIHTAD